jgi:hypothetical protein
MRAFTNPRGLLAQGRARMDTATNRAKELEEKALTLLLRSNWISTPDLFAHLVDRALERIEGSLNLGESPALVASGRLGELVRLKQLAGTHCSYVVGTLDSGTALGLAMITQPALAIVADPLEVASAVDMALTLPTYAPRTKVLVLTDDDDAAHDLRTLGIEVDPSHAPDSLVLSWIERAA